MKIRAADTQIFTYFINAPASCGIPVDLPPQCGKPVIMRYLCRFIR